MTVFHFDRMLLCGTGLIGSSMARGLRLAQRTGRVGGLGEIIGVDADGDALRRGVATGVLDGAVAIGADDALSGESFRLAVASADLIVLAVPVAAMGVFFDAIAPVLSPTAVLTDVGSTKGHIDALASVSLGDALSRFVAGHPIAGAETSGIDAGTADLFAARDVILCPGVATASDALVRVEAMWRVLHARVATMTPAHHDRLFAGVSHLPHLLSFAFMEHTLGSASPDERLAFAGAGFRDFTRIAGSNPVMWRDICLANRAALLSECDRYAATLMQLRDAVAAEDGTRLEAIFSRSRAARAPWTLGSSNASPASTLPDTGSDTHAAAQRDMTPNLKRNTKP